MAIAPQHWLSFARLGVGVVAWASLSGAHNAGIVLPLVALACILDFVDGPVARALGTEGSVGRVIDNFCDFGFLAMFFHAAADVSLWLDPTTTFVANHWPRANALPLLALSMSFGAYAIRAVVCAVIAVRVVPSPVGRVAGILNYALALAGASVISLHWSQPSEILAGAMLLVVVVNVAACVQNCLLLVWQLAHRSR